MNFMEKRPNVFRFIVERFPQRDVIKRMAFADNEVDAVRFALDNFFKDNPTQKVRPKRTYQIIV
jgi:hypothetical protein